MTKTIQKAELFFLPGTFPENQEFNPTSCGLG
jgi:hypothetical protein